MSLGSFKKVRQAWFLASTCWEPPRFALTEFETRLLNLYQIRSGVVILQSYLVDDLGHTLLEGHWIFSKIACCLKDRTCGFEHFQLVFAESTEVLFSSLGILKQPGQYLAKENRG